MSRGAQVAVVVLSKDEPELDATLHSLRPQCEALDGECIVVDASEHRLDAIRDAHPWVNWVAYTAPLGVRTTIPHQRNVGVRCATAPIVAFCDAGGIPDPMWLDTLTAPLRNGTWPVSCGPVRSTRPGVYRTINDIDDGVVVESVLTANLAFTRGAFDAVGGFDERFEYGSDADFAWRLIAAGLPPRSIRAAGMGMDWGPWGLQRKRSWRYGKARGRLLRYHPGRRVAIIRKNPELLVYPVLAVSIVAAAALLLVGVLWPITGCIAALMLLRIRNRRHERPWAVLLSHFIYAAALLRELAGACIPRSAPVLHTPKDRDPYQTHLIEALDDHGVRCGYWTGPTRSQTLNAFLHPFQAPLLRLRGVRVVHFHWMHQYDLAWARRLTLVKRVMRALLSVRLWSLRSVGIRTVWTAHNLVPHTPIFDDDRAARKSLVAGGTVIAHNNHAAAEIRSQFGATNVHVIPQGVATRHTPARVAARVELGIDPAAFVITCIGRVESYKRFDDVLRGAVGLSSSGAPVSVRVVGGCSDDAVQRAIESAAETAREAGVAVHVSLGRVEEDLLSAELAAANVVAYPFASITNSGSVLLALQSGRAALIRDLEALAELPDAAVIRAGAGVAGVHTALQQALDLGVDKLDSMGASGMRWTAERTWDRAGAATRAVYEAVLR